MPCDEVRTVTLDLPNLDKATMQEALEALGYQAAVSYQEGKLVSRIPLTEDRVKKIKREYSRQAVKKIAKKRKWTLTENDETHFTLER